VVGPLCSERFAQQAVFAPGITGPVVPVARIVASGTVNESGKTTPLEGARTATCTTSLAKSSTAKRPTLPSPTRSQRIFRLIWQALGIRPSLSARNSPDRNLWPSKQRQIRCRAAGKAVWWMLDTMAHIQGSPAGTVVSEYNGANHDALRTISAAFSALID
jgi:hypothetical protein